MTLYRLGSHGLQVTQIQEALKARGHYRGLIDGQFGGGTQSAVIAFQHDEGLVADGRVGPKTWAALIGQTIAISTPTVVDEDLARRCLALTGAFETGSGVPDCFCGLSGDFDGQGISFGVLQWNFGQKSLQPLLKEMLSDYPAVARTIFNVHFETLEAALSTSDEDLMIFARAVQHPIKHTVYEPWRGYAKALGRTTEFQKIQVKYAHRAFAQALKMCADYQLWSERAVALMFDIVTQNGSINAITKAQIVGDIKALGTANSENDIELRKLEIVANRRAEAANPRWIDDVRRRKLCIARGYGLVHGIDYDIEQQFGIRLARYTT